MITKDQLRTALFSQPVPLHEEDASLVQAAVLFPLSLRNNGFSVLLTQRTAHLKDHAGQISFPGGRLEKDDQSPQAAALREAEEEIGLLSHQAEVLGYLPDYCTRATAFRITPTLAIISSNFTPKPNAFEVEALFEVPLSFLMDPKHHKKHSYPSDTGMHDCWAIPYQNHFIWGATAAIILSLFERLPHAT